LAPARRNGREATEPTAEQIISISPAAMNKPAPLVFTQAAWSAIESTVGAAPAETGGPLGGTRGSGVIEEFHLDHNSDRTSVTYYPDLQTVNTLMREEWNPAGINLLGFVHSHPRGSTHPSRPDLEYSQRIMQGIPELDRFVLPIVQTAPDTGRFSLGGYAAVRNGSRATLVDLDVHVLPPHSEASPAPAFDRVHDSYDLQVMARARIVAVGCGGSAAFLEDMARAGIGEFVLIDPDVVEEPNLATQQTYRTDLGTPKVDAIARRLADINPNVRVWTVRAKLDELTDAAVRRLTVGWLPGSLYPCPASSILGAFTDNFEAQSRIHRLGLHLGVAVVGGIVWAQGRGIEVTFAAPGVTSACIRCAQSSRYAAYLDQGFQNDVGSAGSPIWATSRLNALKQPIVLGLLHTLSRVADPEHPATLRYRRLLTTIQNRNLVLASLDPDIHETLGLRQFTSESPDGVDTPTGRDVETILWRQPVPDHPDNGYDACPDCGGTGDLSTSMGRFMSTIQTPRVFGEHRHEGSDHGA
jgi:proteasome lid subunit RPN8/RPN11